MNYARKAMILCGHAQDFDSHWKISQLKPELHAICSKYKNHFDEESAPSFGIASSSAAEEDEKVCSLDEDELRD